MTDVTDIEQLRALLDVREHLAATDNVQRTWDARLRTALPALLDELERLRAEAYRGPVVCLDVAAECQHGDESRAVVCGVCATGVRAELERLRGDNATLTRTLIATTEERNVALLSVSSSPEETSKRMHRLRELIDGAQALAAISALCRGESPDPLPDHPAVRAVRRLYEEGDYWEEEYNRTTTERDAALDAMAALTRGVEASMQREKWREEERDAAFAQVAELRKARRDWEVSSDTWQEMYDAARARVVGLKADMLTVARAIGCVYEADGHNDEPAETDTLVAEIRAIRTNSEDHCRAVDEYAARALAAEQALAAGHAAHEALRERVRGMRCQNCSGDGTEKCALCWGTGIDAEAARAVLEGT